jgi:hypothetical protein
VWESVQNPWYENAVPSKSQRVRRKKKSAVTLEELLSVRLRSWKVPKMRQNFPHRPRDFPKKFPRTATEQKLRNEVWWWLYANEDNAGRIFPSWGEGADFMTQVSLEIFLNYMEDSAWFYEMRARYNARYKWEFGVPWIHCSDEQRRMLADILPSKYPSQFYLPVPRSEDCWVTISEKCNLLVNDATLAQRFLGRVAKERKTRGISAPGKQGGVRRRSLSWSALELMDKRHYGVIGDDGGVRSIISKGRKKYEAMCKDLVLAP